jgi:uncharacterized membrane protein SpoIIM required for sporulation
MMDIAAAAERKMSRELSLRSAKFRAEREEGWQRLEAMISKSERGGIGALSAREAQDLASLYRAAVSSFSVARNIALDRNLLMYLENLTLRAYLVVYGPRGGVMENLGEFLRRTWPESVRALRKHLLIMAIIFFAGAAAGFMMVRSDINNFSLFVGEWMAGERGPESTREELLKEELFPEWPERDGFLKMFVVFANFLFTHNARIGLLCFGLGFLLGIPTVLLMAQNGAMLGAFIALHARLGLTVDFIGWLSIHGVTEILAILLMGAAGLSVAENILFPGRMGRIDNLKREGFTAASVVTGAVLMLFVAGIIEGGFRQLIAHTGGRFIFAAVTVALWTAYFALAGRRGKIAAAR